MTQKKYSSPIPSSIPDKDVDNDSRMESEYLAWNGQGQKTNLVLSQMTKW